MKDRNVDSIWPTEEAFLVTKSSYDLSQSEGREMVAGIFD